jgi:chemotaxis protein MotB
MKQTTIPLLVTLLLFSSCDTGKNLNAANEQIQIQNKEITELNQQNAILNAKLSDDEKQISRLKEENARYVSEIENCRKSRDAIAQRMEDLNRTLEQQGNSLESIRKKAIDALGEFHDAGIEVKYRNGMVYVSMQDQLMFPSGSARISEGGKRALSVIADILMEYPQVSAIIVGNTDSMKVVKGYRDNWSLSTERANAIVRTLRDMYGVDPSRLTAAGKSEYHPVASNATPEGRAKNRNTYIIINPDLSRIWILSQKYP